MIVKILNVLGWLVWLACVGIFGHEIYLFFTYHYSLKNYIVVGSIIYYMTYISIVVLATRTRWRGIRLGLIPPALLAMRWTCLYTVLSLAGMLGMGDFCGWAAVIATEVVVINLTVFILLFYRRV